MSNDKKNTSIPSQPTTQRDRSISTEHGTFDSIDYSEKRDGANNVRNSMPAPKNPHRGGGSQGDDNQGNP